VLSYANTVVTEQDKFCENAMLAVPDECVQEIETPALVVPDRNILDVDVMG